MLSPARAPIIATPWLVSGPTSDARPVRRAVLADRQMIGRKRDRSDRLSTCEGRESIVRTECRAAPPCATPARSPATRRRTPASSTATDALSRSAAGSSRPTRAAPMTTSAAAASSGSSAAQRVPPRTPRALDVGEIEIHRWILTVHAGQFSGPGSCFRLRQSGRGATRHQAALFGRSAFCGPTRRTSPKRFARKAGRCAGDVD